MSVVTKAIGGLFGGNKAPTPAPPPPTPTTNQAAGLAKQNQDEAMRQAQESGFASTIKTSGQGAADEDKAVKKTLGG